MLRVQVNRGLDGKFKKISDMLEGYKEEYLKGVSRELLKWSPADHGVYMKNHNIGSGDVGASVPGNKGTRRPKNVSATDPSYKAQFEGEALSNLYSQLSSVGKSTRVVFSNAAKHRDKVEIMYGVYTSTAREHKRIAQEAAQDVKART